MFEKSAAQLVERLCGQYVEGVDQENLKISMWKGEVTMEQVALKSTAFDSLKLPITLREGSIGRLHMQVPWSKLGSAPVIVTVQDVNAVIVPHVSDSAFETSEERRKRLERDVEAQRKALLSKADGDSYLAQVITGVVDNLVVKFERIQLRYEDSVTVEGLPFAVELGLDNLSLVTADEDWKEQSFLPDQKVLHKLGTLAGLCVRWHSEAHVKPSEPPPPLLHPLSATLQLRLSKSGSVEAGRPMAAVCVAVSELMLSVDQLSLRDAAAVAAAWAAQARRAQRAGRRPRVPSVVGHAREWWQFAIGEARLQVEAGGVECARRSAAAGREYRALWKRALGVLPVAGLSEGEWARMAAIEDAMPREFVLAVRRGMLVHLQREAEEHVARQREKEAGRGMLSRTQGTAEVRRSSKKVAASVGRLHVENLCAPGGEGAANGRGREAKVLSAEHWEEGSTTPLLAVAVELNPAGGAGGEQAGRRPQPLDMSVDVKLQRSILRVDKAWIERMMEWKANLDREIERLGVAAAPTPPPANPSISTAARLAKRVGSQRTLIAISADIQAPTIHVPAETDTVVLKLGRIAVSSALADKPGAEQRDKFDVELTEVELLRGNPDQLRDAVQVLHPITAALQLGVATVKDDPDVAQLRAELRVEGVRISLTEQDALALAAAVQSLQLQLSPDGCSRGGSSAVHDLVPEALGVSMRSLSNEGFAQSLSSMLRTEQAALASIDSSFRLRPTSQGSMRARRSTAAEAPPPKGMELECVVSSLAVALLASRGPSTAEPDRAWMNLQVERVEFSYGSHGFATDARLKISDFDVTHPSAFPAPGLGAPPETVTVLTARGAEDLLELRVVQTTTQVAGQDVQDFEVSMTMGKIKFCLCPPAIATIVPQINRFAEPAPDAGSLAANRTVKNPAGNARATASGDRRNGQVLKGAQTLTFKVSSVDLRLVDVQESKLVPVVCAAVNEVDLHFLKNRDQSTRLLAHLRTFEIENESVDVQSKRRKVLTAASGTDTMLSIDYSTELRGPGPNVSRMSAQLARLGVFLNATLLATMQDLLLQLSEAAGNSRAETQEDAASSVAITKAPTNSNENDVPAGLLELDLHMAGFTLFFDRPSNPAEGVEFQVRELSTRRAEHAAEPDVVGADIKIGVVVLCDERKLEASSSKDIKRSHVADIEGQVKLLRFFGGLQAADLPSSQQFKHAKVDLESVALATEEQTLKLTHAILVEAMQALGEVGSRKPTAVTQPPKAVVDNDLNAPEAAADSDPQPLVDDVPSDSATALVIEAGIKELVFSYVEYSPPVHDTLKPIQSAYRDQTLRVIASGCTAQATTFSGGARESKFQLQQLVIECEDLDEHPASKARADDDGRLKRRLLASESEDRFTRKTKSMQSSLRKLFRKHDDSQNSKLNVDELMTTLADVGACFSEDQAQVLLDQLDEDQDGEVDEDEFLKLVWMSLGEQPPEDDPSQGDVGPESPGAPGDPPAAAPFLSVEHSKERTGEESLIVKCSRMEVDLSLEPLGMIHRLHQFLSEMAAENPMPDSKPEPGAVAEQKGLAELWGTLESVQGLRLPYAVDRAEVLAAAKPPPRDLIVELSGVEVCLAADTREENKPAVFVWVNAVRVGACQGKGGGSGGWEHSFEASVEDVEVGYADKVIGKYDAHRRTRKGHDVLLGRNSFRFREHRMLAASAGGLQWRRTASYSVDQDVEMEIALSHLVFLQTFWDALKAKAQLEAASDDEEDEDLDKRGPPNPERNAEEKVVRRKPKKPRTSKQSKGQDNSLAHEKRTLVDVQSSDRPANKNEKGAVTALNGSASQMDSQMETWSIACGKCHLEITDDLQKNIPLAKFEVSKLLLDNRVESAESSAKAEVELSCSMHNSRRMAWEPVLERWSCSATIVTPKSEAKQRLVLDAPKRLEVSVAPEHLRDAVQAHQRFKEAVKQSKSELLTEAPTLARFASSKQINDDLSSFFAKFTPESTRLFHNRTALDLRLRVLSDDDAGFFALLPPTKTASIDVNQLGHLQIQPVMLSAAVEWSAPLAGLQRQPSDLAVVCNDASGRPAAHVILRCKATEILAFAPWTMQNLLPIPATISLHRHADPSSPAFCSLEAEPGPLLQQFGADLAEDVFLSVAIEGSTLRTVQNVPIGNVPIDTSSFVDTHLPMKDDEGRDLELRVSVARVEGGTPTLRVYPQLVMVNRSGLPLVFGRCRDRREKKTGEVHLEVQVVGGQRPCEGEQLHSAAGWIRREDADIQGWVRSASAVKEVGGGAWNLRDPEAVLLSLPEGPEWSPCVSIAGAENWVEIAHDDADETQDIGEAQGRFIKLLGASRYGVDVDGDGTVDRVEEGGEVSYSLGLTMKFGDIPFHRSIYIDFMPMHNIVNNTDKILQVAQFSSRPLEDIILQVEPDLLMSTFGAFHQQDDPESHPHRLVMRYADDAGLPLTHWSGPFSLGEERMFPMRLWTGDDEREAMHVVCEIRRWMNSNFINFLPHDEDKPLYQVCNVTARHTVSVWQLGSPLQEHGAFRVQPGEKRMLSFDDVDSLLKLGVRMGQQAVFVDMSRLGQKGIIHDGHNRASYQIRISGSTRWLEIKDVEIKDHASAADDELLLDINMQFGGLGLSMVNSEREELLYASLQSLVLDMTVYNSKLVITGVLEKLHVDNQTSAGPRKAVIFPLFAGSTPHPLTASAELCREVAMPYWNKIEVCDSEFCVQLQEIWLYQLLQFEEDAYNHEGSTADEGQASSLLVRAGTGTAVELEQTIRALSFLASVEGVGEQGLYIERLSLGTMQGDVSVYGLSEVPSRPEKPSVGPLSSLYESLRVVQAPMGSVPDIHRHHIKLPELQQENVSLVKGTTIGGKLWDHYKRSLYRGAIKLMGSADFWANVLGSASDSKESALERQRQKAAQRAEGRPESIEKGLRQGMAAVGEGFLSGLTGIVERPMEAVKDKGAAGLFHGIGQGLLGAFTKPAAGVLQLGSKVTEGTVAQVKGVERVPRERQPRAVYMDRKLRDYDEKEAECYMALCELREKPAFVGYVEMDASSGLLVADDMISVVQRKDWSQSTWSSPVNKLSEVKWHSDECRLQLRCEDPSQARTVTVSDRDRGKSLAEYLEKQVEAKSVPQGAEGDGSIDDFFAMMPPPPRPG